MCYMAAGITVRCCITAALNLVSLVFLLSPDTLYIYQRSVSITSNDNKLSLD